MQTLIKNIKQIVQVEREENMHRKEPLRGAEMQELGSINDAWLWIRNGKIAGFGRMENCPEIEPAKIIDAAGKLVFPSWVDSHTHLVFAASREREFVDRINGLSYEEIAARGGGILNSARWLAKASEEFLTEQAYQRLLEVQSYGTGAIEIKSGYGLNAEAEIKMLRVIRRLKSMTDMDIKATFLGAHALPLEYKNNRQAYLDLVVDTMLPQIADEGLADYIDIFCEKGFFTVEETRRVLEAGLKYGLKGKIHTNQFNSLGAIQAAVELGAVSVDHLEVVEDRDIAWLQNAKTIATLLPSAPFFLNDHYPPARRLLEAGLPVALATDYNPGSTPSGRMPFVLSLACIKLRMTPEEAINAATWNGACALEFQDQAGSIAVGKPASLFITKPMPGIAYLPYAFGSDVIETIFLKGKIVN